MEAAIMQKTVYDFARALPNRTTEIYQEERLHIAGLLNVLDELEPVELEMHKSVRHGTCAPINILFAARDFYALEALSATLCDAKENAFDPARHSHVFWFDAFTEFRNAYAAKLATAIFDYTVSVAAGEMRHAKTEATRYIEDFPYTGGNGRYDVYGTLDEFEPYSVLAAASRVFSNDVDWEAGFGGAKWKQIADAGLKRKVLSDVAFIDHCVDLSHNNSVYFDKGAGIFELAYAEEYRKFLDLKRKALPEELLWEIGAPIASLVRRARILGIMSLPCGERSGRNVDRVLCYIPIRWGTKYVSTALGMGKFCGRRKDRDWGEASRAMTMSDFRVGDKVICLETWDNCTLKPNISTGTVVHVGANIAVQWDELLEAGHACDGHCRNGYGWWLKPHMLKKVHEKTVFAVGDKVKMVSKNSCVKPGTTGKVLVVNSYTLAVMWDEYVTNPETGEIMGHHFTPECRRGYGWTVCEDYVEKVTETPVKKSKVPEILQAPPKCDFEIGDLVTISNTGPIYSAYESWVRKYAPQHLPHFHKGVDWQVGMAGTIVAIGNHLSWTERHPLCLVQTKHGVCVIGSHGLAKKEKHVA
jgi:hypothetical protein